jgi:hypothetical protein
LLIAFSCEKKHKISIRNIIFTLSLTITNYKNKDKMARKLSLLSFLMLFMGITSFAQSLPCGFDNLNAKMKAANPEYAKAVKTMENRWIGLATSSATSFLTYTPTGYVYEIPVVIHVIHTGGAIGTLYNPTDAQLTSMISYLNQSYAATWPSYPDTTTGASGGGVRIPIKFILAKRSPTGAATTGILRVDGSVLSGYAANGVYRSSAGASDASVKALSRYDPADYYNIYVVNKIDGNDLTSTGGIAGYAYFPGYPIGDGMVMVASQAKSGSSVITHEFGHAYSLYHTFEGDETFPGSGVPVCPPNTNCNTDGDLVCDTEPHIRENVAFPSTWCPPNDVNPCTGGSYKNVQHNFMDYTQCPPNRFTAGQRLRVINVMHNERSGYLTSSGGLAPVGTITSACIPTSSTGASSDGPYIVDFNGLTVWTGSQSMENSATYVDHAYTQQSYVKSGSVYPINVTTETTKQNVRVFIDFNNNGSFADAGELVFSHNGTTTGTEVHSGNITIPATGATTCNMLRMRVVAVRSTSSVTDYACGPIPNGQAEDYGVYIKNPISADSVYIGLTSGTIPACTGSSLTFKATTTGTPTYSWFVNNLPVGVTTSTYTTSTLKNGDVVMCKTYYTGSCGADSAQGSWVASISSSIGATARITLRNGANPGCAGQPLVFKVNVSSGGPSPVYQWKRNGINVGFNVDTFATNTLVAGDYIWCNVTPNSACSTTPVNSDSIKIVFGTVAPGVNIALTTGVNPSCDSTLLTFTATPNNGGATPVYTWYVNGVLVAGATLSTYTNTYLKNNDSVRCRMISNHPCVAVANDTAWSNKFIVNRNPKVVPTLMVNISRGSNPGCLDSLLEFTAVATDGGGSPLVAWYVNSTLMSYGSIFGSTTFANNDTIVCKMYVTAGSCNTVDSLIYGPIILTRGATPSAPIISLIGNLLVSSVPTGIQWYGPHGLIPGATSATYHPTEIGNYYAVVVNSGCNSATSNVLHIALLSISPVNMSEVRIYPNPTTGNITLDWGTLKVNVSVDVFTVTGQRVYHSLIENTTQKSIDLSNLGNGNYFVVIHDTDGKTGTATITLAH